MVARHRTPLTLTPSRRSVLALGGFGLVSGIAPVLSSGAQAQQADDLVRSEYTATKQGPDGPVKLALYRKTSRNAQEARDRPVLFLVHGSSISALPSYDLSVPGRGEYSLMNVFARMGFDVWTMDHENYGRSSRTASNSDIASGAEDLRAAVEIVSRETGQSRFSFLGQSSGALRAGLFAMQNPDRVNRLVLEAFTYTGVGSPTLKQRAEKLDFYRSHNRRPRDRDMIRSIFTRDKPGTSDPAVPEALADAEMVYGDTIPTGTYLDMTANLPIVDPARVTCPVLVIRGEHDGIATEEDLLNFFKALPNPDRQFSVIPGAAHALTLSLTRDRYWHVAGAFLTMPTSAQG